VSQLTRAAIISTNDICRKKIPYLPQTRETKKYICGKFPEIFVKNKNNIIYLFQRFNAIRVMDTLVEDAEIVRKCKTEKPDDYQNGYSFGVPILQSLPTN